MDGWPLLPPEFPLLRGDHSSYSQFPIPLKVSVALLPDKTDWNVFFEMSLAAKLKKLRKVDNTSLGIGVVFFLVFWLNFDSLMLGLAMGLALGAAYATSVEVEKANKKEERRLAREKAAEQADASQQAKQESSAGEKSDKDVGPIDFN